MPARSTRRNGRARPPIDGLIAYARYRSHTKSPRIAATPAKPSSSAMTASRKSYAPLADTGASRRSIPIRHRTIRRGRKQSANAKAGSPCRKDPTTGPEMRARRATVGGHEGSQQSIGSSRSSPRKRRQSRPRGRILSQGLPAFAFADCFRPREWFGVGLGSSVEKLLYLPEAHTDFLLAVIAEELGFAGVAAILGLFRVAPVPRVRDQPSIGASCAPVRRVDRAGHRHLDRRAGDHQHRRQHGRVPTKGLTLPPALVRGSGIVANCVAVAILLRVDYENRRLLRGFTV